MSIPTTQKAIIVHEKGGPEVIKYEDVAVPSINRTQVLVKNSYAGVNFVDAYFRKGSYGSSYPLLLGREAAGEVVAVGDDVTKFKVGDKVGYLTLEGGSFAEYTAIESDGRVSKLPDDISERDWATTALQLITADTLVLNAHHLSKDDTALIYAPVGGVGQYLVPIAKSIGATVIAVTSSEEKAQLAKQYGADYVINYKNEDIAERVNEITNGKGVTVAYDSIGGATFQASIASLGLNGRLVIYGSASGPLPAFKFQELPAKDLSLTHSSIFTATISQERWDFYSQALFKRLREKKLKIDVYKEYPVSEYAKATTELESGKTHGKLILKI